ncbi:MAG: hypothetical protein Q9192_002033 [Flavoplaca navasiana]
MSGPPQPLNITINQYYYAPPTQYHSYGSGPVDWQAFIPSVNSAPYGLAYSNSTTLPHDPSSSAMLIPSTPRQPPEIPNGRATHGQSARLAARPDYTVVNTSNFDESSSNETPRVPVCSIRPHQRNSSLLLQQLTNAVPKAVIQPPQRSQTPKNSPTTEARPQGQKRPVGIALPLMVPSDDEFEELHPNKRLVKPRTNNHLSRPLSPLQIIRPAS